MNAANRQAFLDRLAKGPLLLDGGMGTELIRAGLSGGEISEMWTLSRPGTVSAVHEAYDDAGAEALYTNTFGANGVKLSRAGLHGNVKEMNRRAVELARTAAKRSRWVIGSMGPTGELLEPYGDLPEERARAAFREQARALVEAEVRVIAVESHADPREAALAVAEARAAGDAVIVATMTFEGPERDHRTVMGTTPEQAVEILTAAGADVVGVNCGRGIEVAVAVVRRMRAATAGIPIAAKPNAGVPVMVEGRTVYPLGPEQFSRDAKVLLDEGVTLLGGCCGTTPAHIRALAALDAFRSPAPSYPLGSQGRERA